MWDKQWERVSTSSPVAIFATMMALPITSAGRFSPWGPFIVLGLFLSGAVVGLKGRLSKGG
jgi:putative copper export protein